MEKILIPFMALNAVIFCDAAEKPLPATTYSHQEAKFSQLMQEARWRDEYKERLAKIKGD